LESTADILADTERYLAEAKATLKAVNAGAKLSAGMTREEAVHILTENIALYEATLRRYGWRKDAPRP
jgi:hypothetical protein